MIRIHLYVYTNQGMERHSETNADAVRQIQLTSITEKGLFANGNTAEGTVAVGVGDDTPTNA